jgi:hypothetical protein
MSSDAVTQAATDWLNRFVDRYAGTDSGESDPVHDVRVRAQQMLHAGPTRQDPFTIAEMLANALPNDERAAVLGDDWRDELSRIES